MKGSNLQFFPYTSLNKLVAILQETSPSNLFALTETTLVFTLCFFLASNHSLGISGL